MVELAQGRGEPVSSPPALGGSPALGGLERGGGGASQHSWSHCHGAWPLSPYPTPSCRAGTTHRAGERGFCSWGLSWGGVGPLSCCAP